MKENDEEFLFYLLDALLSLMCKTSLLYRHDIQKCIIDSGCLPRLMTLLKYTCCFLFSLIIFIITSSESYSILMPCLRLLDNIHDLNEIEILIPFLNIFFKLISHPSVDISLMAIDNIAEICLRKREQISVLLHNSLCIEKIISLMHSKSCEVK